VLRTPSAQTLDDLGVCPQLAEPFQLADYVIDGWRWCRGNRWRRCGRRWCSGGLIRGSAATPLIQWRRWITPDAQRALPAVQRLVRTVADGDFVEGRLPDVLASLGIGVPPPRPRRVHSESIDDWVSEWLRDTLPSPDVCAAACAKVLKFAGDEACARDLRAVLRKSIEERTHFPADEAVYCSVALAMIDSDEVGADNAQAQADMDLSRASTEAVYSALTDTSLSPEARHEQATNLVMLLINSAMAAVASGEVRVAADILKQIRAIVDKDYDPGSGKYARAATFVVSGLISHYEDNPRRALISWRTATLLAREIGAMEIAYVALENRWRVAWEIGEDKLARMLAEETESVSRLVPGRRPAALAELSRLHPASGGADASVEPRPARIRALRVVWPDRSGARRCQQTSWRRSTNTRRIRDSRRTSW
jgi:hypothetical protein